MSEQKLLDPTAFGLFLVATVSLPLALGLLIGNDGAFGVPDAGFFLLIGFLILAVAFLAYRCGSNFGFIVFGLVGAAVFMTGFFDLIAAVGADPDKVIGDIAGTDSFVNLTFAFMFFLAIIWSIFAKTPKNLTVILVTTTLVFLTVGLSLYITADWWHYAIGFVALLNFLANIFMAFALATEKLPVK